VILLALAVEGELGSSRTGSTLQGTRKVSSTAGRRSFISPSSTFPIGSRCSSFINQLSALSSQLSVNRIRMGMKAETENRIQLQCVSTGVRVQPYFFSL